MGLIQNTYFSTFVIRTAFKDLGEERQTYSKRYRFITIDVLFLQSGESKMETPRDNRYISYRFTSVISIVIEHAVLTNIDLSQSMFFSLGNVFG